jgi:hypothetical protein
LGTDLMRHGVPLAPSAIALRPMASDLRQDLQLEGA